MVTSLREFAKLCQLVVASDYPIDAEITGACVRGYLAERVCQAVQLVVAGDYPIDAEITWAGGAGPLVTLLREFANLCQRWLRAITRLTPRLPGQVGLVRWLPR